jgi:hypothetical protein
MNIASGMFPMAERENISLKKLKQSTSFVKGAQLENFENKVY